MFVQPLLQDIHNSMWVFSLTIKTMKSVTKLPSNVIVNKIQEKHFCKIKFTNMIAARIFGTCQIKFSTKLQEMYALWQSVPPKPSQQGIFLSKK